MLKDVKATEVWGYEEITDGVMTEDNAHLVVEAKKIVETKYPFDFSIIRVFNGVNAPYTIAESRPAQLYLVLYKSFNKYSDELRLRFLVHEMMHIVIAMVRFGWGEGSARARSVYTMALDHLATTECLPVGFPIDSEDIKSLERLLHICGQSYSKRSREEQLIIEGIWNTIGRSRQKVVEKWYPSVIMKKQTPEEAFAICEKMTDNEWDTLCSIVVRLMMYKFERSNRLELGFEEAIVDVATCDLLKQPIEVIDNLPIDKGKKQCAHQVDRYYRSTGGSIANDIREGNFSELLKKMNDCGL